MSKKTDALIDKLAEIDGRFFSEYKGQVEKNRSYYNLEYGTRLSRDNGFDVLVPPTATRAIDEPADHLLFHPKIRVPVRPTRDDEEKEQLIAERKRKFANSWWSQVSLRFNPVGDGRKPLLNEGKIAIRKTLRWELIPDMPKRSNFRSNRTFQQAKDEYRARIAALGRDEWLWDVELLDNTTVYEDPTSHRDPAYVFLRYKVLAEEAKRRWPEKKELWKEYADFDEVDYTEYWSKPVTERDGTTTPGEFIQWVERDVVHDDENPYPYIPVIIEDAGFGVNHRFAKPADKFVGMTQHAFPIFEAEAIQMTSLQEVTKISAFPMIKSRNMADDKQINVGPGTVIPLEGGKNDPDAEDVEIEQWPNVPDSVLGMLEKTDRLANSTFKMNVLGGVPQKGVETASEADQNVRNATAKLTSPVAALERLVMRITTQVFIDIEQVLHAPVTVFGTNAKDEGESTLRPTDINRYYQVSAELGTSDEEALSENKARFWMEAALRAPFLSYRTAMERGGITEEPMQELITRSAEEVYLSDAFKQIRIVTGAQSFGELQAYIEQLQNGGGAPAPGGGNATGGGVNDRTGLQGDDPATTLLNSALRDRDTNLGASQLEA